MVAAVIYAAPARQVWQLKAISPESRVKSQETVYVRLAGDEYYHYWETRDGKLAVEQADGTFVVTDEPVPTPSEVQARRMASPLQAYRAPQSVGKINLAPRGLVILVSYKDLAFQAENDSAAMSDMMNKLGYDYNGATGSARDYFIAQSNGQYQPVFDVVGPVTLPKNRADYGGNIGGDNTDKDPKQMIVDACKAVDAKVDFTKYDNDGDNKIDFVYILYAGIGENDFDGEKDAVWAHNNSAYSKNCTLDKKRLDNYACSGEIDGITKARSGIGTFCHEFGHVIGFPDYYDTTYGTNYNQGLTPNNWSTMDHGCYNNDVNTPPNYSIFDKYYFGWVTPKVLAPGAQLTITLGTEYDEGFQINGNESLVLFSHPDTVYYIENRQLQGWDAALPGHGLLVWQVVYNASAWSANTPNNVAYKPRYTVISAAGGYIGFDFCLKEDDKGNCTLYEKSTYNTFPGSKNVTSIKLIEGIELTDIAEKDGKITFKVNEGDVVSGDAKIQNTEYRVQKILRNGQIFILRGDKTYTIMGQQHN